MISPDSTTPETPQTPAYAPLPENATPEEKELHWYKYVYQGDRIPQLTLRAVLMGGVLGMFMAISNLYTTLKLGWSFGVTITACVLSYVIWNAIRAVSAHQVSPMTILENNCMQSTAAAAGSSTGATVGTAFGALLLIEGYHQPWQILLPFVFLTAALGVFVAIPMKRQIINIERLPFPTGMAAAETLRSLHSHGREAVRKAYTLLSGLFAGAIVGLLRGPQEALNILDRLYAYAHIPELIEFRHSLGFLNPLAGRGLWPRTLGFEPGLLMIAGGAFVGVRVSLSMLAGSVLLFYVVGPWILTHYPLDIRNYGDGTVNFITWALWGGTSIMVFSSLTSLALQWRTFGRAFRILSKKAPRHPQMAELERIEVPITWLVAGLVPIGIGLVIVNRIAFGMSPLLGLIAVAMSFVAALVCCRATGETDTTPIGAVGKLTQLLYAVLAKGNVRINLMSAGVTAAAGGASADLLTDLKSGYLLGANPRKQFLAQFLGLFFGVAAVIPCWYLMVPDLKALQAFNPPASQMWQAMAVLLSKGLDQLPMSDRVAILIGAGVGLLLPVLAAVFPRSAHYLPSAMGLGLAWVVPFQNSLSFALGAILAWIWMRLHKRTAESYTFPLAAGIIAGESIVLALIAMASTGKSLIWGPG